MYKPPHVTQVPPPAHSAHPSQVAAAAIFVGVQVAPLSVLDMLIAAEVKVEAIGPMQRSAKLSCTPPTLHGGTCVGRDLLPGERVAHQRHTVAHIALVAVGTCVDAVN